MKILKNGLLFHLFPYLLTLLSGVLLNAQVVLDPPAAPITNSPSVESTPSNRQPSTIRVSLSITGDNGLDSIIRSYLSRDFREIPDVVITDDDPMFTIHIVAMDTKIGPNAVRSGYAMSIVTTFKDLRTKADIYSDHFLRVLPLDDLESSCREISAKIDGSLFEDERKFTSKQE